ncbi:MAG: 3-deoxy-D-manno-octulosonic acid transferase [Pseudomonadota bacterium]|nr:3-deoxy-D-manno-octulosonic acid transferase [Pseudomonadota bacterium]
MLTASNYRLLTGLLSPLIPLWLFWRRMKGKEDAARLRERFGFARPLRPQGMLLWLHAASVGEANSVLLLIGKIRERFPKVHILLTTGTVTSARLMEKRLPEGVIHQYAPVDTPQASLRFIRYWKPDIALWVESELWPNLVFAADYYQCFMGIINARLSERSFAAWQKHPQLIGSMLKCFNVIFAQSEEDARRLEQLGAKEALCVGNLKYDAALLPCDEDKLIELQSAIAGRPVWLMASTHPGEEALGGQAHRQLSAQYPALLTIIVPRHPERGGAIAAELKTQWRSAQRSKQEQVTADTQIYIADTLGELGLFYRLSEIVFMGGSLVKHGGQNPLEPARLSCGILTGPHTYNFQAVYKDMEAAHAVLRVKNAQELAAEAGRLLGDAEALEALQKAARRWVESQVGASDRLLSLLSPVLAYEPGKRSA